MKENIEENVKYNCIDRKFQRTTIGPFRDCTLCHAGDPQHWSIKDFDKSQVATDESLTKKELIKNKSSYCMKYYLINKKKSNRNGISNHAQELFH